MRELIILAGGFGTRLKHLLNEDPKPLAGVAGKPFLHYLLQYLQTQSIDRYIFSLNYQAEKIIEYINQEFAHLNSIFVVEPYALGTGGAIAYASQHCTTQNFYVVNADSYFEIDFSELEKKSKLLNSKLVLASKQVLHPHRYGTFSSTEEGLITAFKEKQAITHGWINAGIYYISDKNIFDNCPEVFSFEKQILEQKTEELKIAHCEFDSFFIDIGIPEDFHSANQIFSEQKKEELIQTSRNRCLMLDRDGVINVLRKSDYVKSLSEFEFKKNLLIHLAKIQAYFGRIVVVTNQQGIGKAVMTEAQLDNIHEYMVDQMRTYGITVDKVYYCPHLASENCNCRKPKPGMLDAALKEFTEIDPKKSYFVGDSVSDVEAAKRAGVWSVAMVNPENQKQLEECVPNLVILSFDELIPKILEFEEEN
ncbi:MAG TPA: HAD-IIIA family hydrolase [Saprospiraceae bacterium]|nr:HAD-IIIA family hydrolase [Saprospiraceae bacterium]